MWQVGDACVVNIGGISDSGVVRFVGKTQFAAGEWFGIELDHHLGKNDGSVDGVRYFALNKANGPFGVFISDGSCLSVKTPGRVGTTIANNSTDAQDRLRNVIALLERKIKTLREELTALQRRLAEANEQHSEQISDLQATVETLTFREIDLNEEICILNDKLIQLTTETTQYKLKNKSLEDELAIRGRVDEYIDAKVDPKIDHEGTDMTWKKNIYFQETIKHLQESINDLLEQYENSLNENTMLIEKNIGIETDYKKIYNELNFSKEMIVDLTNQLEAQENSENVVNYLTERNNELALEKESILAKLQEFENVSDRVHSEESNNSDIIQLQLQERLHEAETKVLKNDIIIKKSHEENERLSLQLEKMSKELSDTKEHEVINLKLQLGELQKHSEINELYRKFSEHFLNSEEPSWSNLRMYIQFLKVSINQGNLINTPLEIHNYFIKLQVINDIIGVVMNEKSSDQSTVKQFIIDVFPFESWRNQILEGELQPESLLLDECITYITKNDIFEYNIIFFIRLVNNILSTEMPIIFDVGKTETNLDLISSLYEKSIFLTNASISILDTLESKELKNGDISILQPCYEQIKTFCSLFPVINFDSMKEAFKKLELYLKTLENGFKSNLSRENDDIATDYQSPKVESAKDVNVDEGRHYQEDISIKERLIEELNLKINVLKTKLLDNIEQEKMSILLRNQIHGYQTDIDSKEKEISHYKQNITNLELKLENEKLHKYQIIPESNLNRSIIEHEKVSQIDLLSEINNLRTSLISEVNKNSSINNNDNKMIAWLKEQSMTSPNERMDRKYRSWNDYAILMNNIDRITSSMLVTDATGNIFNRDTLDNSIKKGNRNRNILRNSMNDIISGKSSARRTIKRKYITM